MKVLISADMEGVCGVTSWVQVMPPEYGSGPSSTVEYERARARLTREVNAAVERALVAGADEVIVNEAHDGMRNLVPEDLHESVRFITGSDKALGMMQGIDEPGVGAAFFVGYHAKAGTPHAPRPTPRSRTPGTVTSTTSAWTVGRPARTASTRRSRATSASPSRW